MNFGKAIEGLKNGKMVAREGWNGKGMYIYLKKGIHFFDKQKAIPVHIDGVYPGHFNEGIEGTTTILPNINMRTASGNHVTGWLASQTDMLAEDWVEVG